MFILLAAIAIAIVGVLPYALRGHVAIAVKWGFAVTPVTYVILYVSNPSTVWPMLGLPGFIAAVLFTAAAIHVGFMDEHAERNHHQDFKHKHPWVTYVAAALWGAYLITWAAGWPIFRAADYATMIGDVEERVWTEDVQPKNPKHMRWVTYANALAIAQKTVGTAGSIGSQFELDRHHMALQRVKGELVYAIPFDFAGLTPWITTAGSPGFMIVSAEDPERQPRFVELPKGKEMKCTPGAYFGNRIERLLRNNGFLHDGIGSARYELDDNEKPWYVVTTYKPTISWSGEKVTGIALINPVTCAVQRYTPENAPEWIDRIYGAYFVKNYAAWHGLYAGGWWNSWFGKLNLTEPEEPLLIYGSSDKAEWAMGVTSTNDNDDSLISVLYADSRTGKMVKYRMKEGGATETAIIKAINANAQVKFRHLHAKDAQIYNVFGVMAAVAPLLNENNLFQGAAIVPINNVQDVAVGTTQLEAIHAFQVLMSRRGQVIALDKTSIVKSITSEVARIRQDISPNGSVYHVLLKDVPHILTGSSQDHAKLPLTQPGDTVVVEYIGSDQLVVPLRSFDNTTLALGTK